MLLYVFFQKIDPLILRASDVRLREPQKTGTEVTEKTSFRASETHVRASKVLFSTPSQNGNASVFLDFEEKKFKTEKRF